MEEKTKIDFEKTPFKSKKFLAFFISELGWKCTILFMVWKYSAELTLLPSILMMSVIITAGFVQAYTIGGQAALDKYVRIARINAGMFIPGKKTEEPDPEGEPEPPKEEVVEQIQEEVEEIVEPEEVEEKEEEQDEPVDKE